MQKRGSCVFPEVCAFRAFVVENFFFFFPLSMLSPSLHQATDMFQ